LSLAIITKATEVDSILAYWLNKIRLCKYYTWTPKQYNEQKWSDIRMFKMYMELNG